MAQKQFVSREDVFRTLPVPAALRAMIVPAVISQLIVLMYGVVWSQVTADSLTVLLSLYVYRRWRAGRRAAAPGGFFG